MASRGWGVDSPLWLFYIWPQPTSISNFSMLQPVANHEQQGYLKPKDANGNPARRGIDENGQKEKENLPQLKRE